MKRTIIISIAVVALVFGAVSYAGAATGDTTTGNTTVIANAGTLLRITAPASVDLGTIDPETPGSATVTVEGKSNALSTMSASVNQGNFTALTSTPQKAVTGLRGGNIAVDYTIVGTVDYNVDPDTDLSGIVTYSLVQN